MNKFSKGMRVRVSNDLSLTKARFSTVISMEDLKGCIITVVDPSPYNEGIRAGDKSNNGVFYTWHPDDLILIPNDDHDGTQFNPQQTEIIIFDPNQLLLD